MRDYIPGDDADRAAGHDVAYDERISTPSGKAAKDPCVHDSWRLCAFASWRSSPVHPQSSSFNNPRNYFPENPNLSADEALWTPLDIDTESPIIHAVPDTVATTYAYRARYVGKNLKFGPFGDPVVCTVSV